MQEWLIDHLRSKPKDGLELLHNDFKVWCSNLLTIPDKNTGNDIPFDFLPAQDRTWEVIKKLRTRIERWKLRVLKARQQGLTTEILAYDLWEAWKKKNRNSLMLTDRDELTEEKFLMLKNFYYELPDGNPPGIYLKPAHKLDNRGILYLQSKDGKMGLNSKIRVGTVKSKNKGVGMTVYLLHLAEYARYHELTNVTQLMTDLLKAMPKTGEASVIIETTAYPGPFEQEWYNDKSWVNLFIPFTADPGYRKKYNGFKLTESEEDRYGNELEEVKLIRKTLVEWFPGRYNEAKLMDPEVAIVLQQEVMDALAFRRWSIDDECGGDKNLFRRDYPLTADQAFHHVGRYVFPVELLKAQQAEIAVDPPSPIISVLSPLRLNFTPPRDFDQGWWKTALRESPTGPIYVYIKPQPGLKFSGGADPSESNFDSDDNALRFLLCPQRIEACAFDGRMDIYDFADMIYALSMYFNYSLLVVERNAIGVATIKRLQDPNIHYPVANLYRKKVLDRIAAQPEMRYGWHSNANTKPFMVGDTKKHMERGELLLVHPKTYEQAYHYQELPDGGYEGIACKDDGIMALMLASMGASEVHTFMNTRQEDHGQTLNYYINLHHGMSAFKPFGGISNS